MQFLMTHPSSSPPYKLLATFRHGDWNECIMRCSQHSDEVKWKGHRHQTPLHLACFRRPPATAVRSLISACPASVSCQDVDLCTPLHYAMSNGASNEVLRILIRAAPNTVMMPNKWGYMPLPWIWRTRFEEDMNLILTYDELLDGGVMEESWETIKVMIKAAGMRRDETFSEPIHSSNNWRVLHAAVGISCPQSMLRRIIHLFPDQLTECDEEGRLPLSVAAAAPLESESSRMIIEELLKAHPGAAMRIDRKGRLPLHIAVEHGKTWKYGVEALFHAAPQANGCMDSETCLYPFMQAAAFGEFVCCTTIFELLSACPELLQREC